MGTEIHWVAVVAAAVVGFVVGGLWYGPLFLKAWISARGLTEDQVVKQGHGGVVFSLAFVLNLVSAFILDHTIATYGDPSLSVSVMIAGGIALGFIIPAFGVNYLFSRLSPKLFAIDAGYWLVTYCVMGVIIDLLS